MRNGADFTPAIMSQIRSDATFELDSNWAVVQNCKAISIDFELYSFRFDRISGIFPWILGQMPCAHARLRQRFNSTLPNPNIHASFG